MNLSALWTALAALGKFADAVKAFLGFVEKERIREAAEAKGRADSDADHAKAAQQADAGQRAIADQPADKGEVLKRLDEGSA